MPKLRFKREDGTDYPEWNSKSFSDTFSSLNNNTFSRNMLSESGSVCNIHYGDIFVKYGEICDVQKENIPKVNDHIDTGKYDLLQDGDIILADTAEDETVGKATEILNVGTATVISGLHTMACRPNYKFAPMYLGYYINSPTYHNQLLPFMQGIKVTSIGRKNISETSISFPCLEEQQKIADFLSNVDEVIAQSEAEVANLQQQKKAAMQKIFSQEVRFKREDGTDYPEWEEKKLAYCFEERNTKQIPTDEAPLMAFIAYKGVADKGDRYDRSYLVKTDGKKYKRTEYNDFIYSSNNLDVGSIGLNKYGTAVISVVYQVFKVKDTAIPDFISALLQTPENMNKIIQYRQGCLYGQYKIYANDFLSVITAIPCPEEQQKIADFLATYDEDISCAKQELDKWKELKKGLLQQMFA